MTIEELEKKIQEIGAQQDALKAQKQALANVLSQRLAEESAIRTLANMDDVQKMALLQQIQSSGLPSKSVVRGMN